MNEHRKLSQERGQDQEHLGFKGSGKEFVFYPESNRNVLEGFEMGNEMMFCKDL